MFMVCGYSIFLIQHLHELSNPNAGKRHIFITSRITQSNLIQEFGSGFGQKTGSGDLHLERKGDF